MPLLSATTVVLPPPGEGVPPDLISAGAAAALWIAPEGDSWNLTNDPHRPGVITLPGVAGIGAAPRNTIRRALSTGGTRPRWSHADERLITWPVLVTANNDPGAFLALWRRFIRAFTTTTPPAGMPRTGTLRITRADGTWREIAAIYEDGLGQNDQLGYGLDRATAVVSLVAPDPWWYGPEQVAVEFGYTLSRAYVGTSGGDSGTDPYETVSPSNAQGESGIFVFGDVEASPVWTLTGPATGFTVSIAGAHFFYDASLAGGESVIVDVGNLTVASPDGTNMIGNFDWPASSLFNLPTGLLDVNIDIAGAAAGASVVLAYRPRYESS